ncbi:MAG TPA: hypothetical protein VK859_01180 [bacterium]|jgi:hypothetical protein|nr:hypothetical protein [bacterium]
MLKKRPILWISLVGVLVLLNLIKWLPSIWQDRAAKGTAPVLGLELDFPSGPLQGEGSLHRNLFALGSLPSNNMKRTKVKKTKIPTQTQPSPTPTFAFPDGSLREIAGGYRLMGVVSRGGQSQALIGKGDQLFQLGPGEDLEGQYQVEKITDSEVYLTEKQTGNSLRLRIWDDQGTK